MSRPAGYGPKNYELCIVKYELFVPVRRSTPLITLDAPCGGAISRRLGKVCLRQPLLSPCAKLHASNGETESTIVVVLGAYAATVEIQVRPAHARSRERRTAPGATMRAHTDQTAGVTGAATRSGVEVAPPLAPTCVKIQSSDWRAAASRPAEARSNSGSHQAEEP